MKNLNWFQARSIALGGRAVRRELWRKWLTVEHYVWLIAQPVWETQLADRRVVQQSDFGAEEFMAHDWTDEPWPNGPQPPDPPDPPNPPDPPRPPKPPLPPKPPGNGGSDPSNPSDPADPTNPPISDPVGGDSDGGGPGGHTGGGWGGWGSGVDGNGGGDGPKPPVPPKPPRPHQPPNPNVPTITVEVLADLDTDGPSCFIVPPATCTIYVTVTIAGGPAGVGTLSVSGALRPAQLSTGWPGMNQSFTFRDVPVNPGGTVTFFADYGAPGVVPFIHYIGSGSFTFPPNCILFGATWSGDTVETKRCLHGPQGYTGISEDGYDFTASYSTSGQFAVNPAAGAGKSAMNTGADLNAGNNAHGIYTPFPTGTPTHIDWWVAAPRACTVDVDAQGAVSHTSPVKLGIFGANEDDATPPCTFHRTSHESVSPA